MLLLITHKICKTNADKNKKSKRVKINSAKANKNKL